MTINDSSLTKIKGKDACPILEVVNDSHQKKFGLIRGRTIVETENNAKEF